MSPRYLHGYGLIERPLSETVAALDGADHVSFRTRARPAVDRAEAVAYLSHLTHPATRIVVFAVNERWTAAVANGRDGSDFASFQQSFGRRCAARTCRVVEVEPRRGRVNGYAFRRGYAARIFELAGAEGESIRSIVCMDDGGRWVFETYGEPLPIEAGFDYGARRKRDRFTGENLRELLRSLGVEPDPRDAFDRAEQLVLLEARLKNRLWRARVERSACTPADADDPGFAYFERGNGWVPHMRTHAESVVVDLTKAVLLSPRLRERAQPQLEKARRRLGDARYERIAREAEEHLRRRGG